MKPNEDDLFKHTAMTFGEHLEELRVSLFKAVIALAIGFGVGLWFGSTIVQWIQVPLRSTLEDFYKKEAIEYVNARVPPELQNNASVHELVFTYGLVPEERYFSLDELRSYVRESEAQPKSESSQKPADNPEPIQPQDNAPSAPDGVVANDKAAAKVPATAEAALAPIDAAQKAAIPPPTSRDFTSANLARMFVWKKIADDDRLKLDSLSVQEPFVIWMKAGFLAGAVLSSPFVFYFLWQFVAAGLYPHEKRYIHLFLPVSLGLFFAGASLAFFFVFPPVLNFFFGIAKNLGSDVRPRLSEWLSFVLLLPLGFGISFQLPLVMLFLERIHIFTAEIYLSKWRISVLVIAIAAMVLSPGGDPYSMLMMLVPLVGLYFAGIALCKWLPSPRAPAA